jgi:hypothetical protein
MLDEVQRGYEKFGSEGFRSAQVTARLTPDEALEQITELVEKAHHLEHYDAQPLVVTVTFHPPTSQA